MLTSKAQQQQFDAALATAATQVIAPSIVSAVIDVHHW